ncbi:thioredoxin [Pseudochrobactrum sp. MP213Fo]|uniref:thioredoxin n=1 Tax=Pseudochrobactrum sp. MP213Fo TaxID=3022250 RepID=UPI003BA36875
MNSGNNPYDSNPYGASYGSAGGLGGQGNTNISYGGNTAPDTGMQHAPAQMQADDDTAGALASLAGFGSSAPVADGLIKDTTTANFAADVLSESRNQPVLVDFWAPWCGPCRQLTPLIEGAVNAAAGAVKLVKMNIEDHPTIAGQLGIQSIPAVIAFVDGQPVDGFMGALPESKITEFIDKVAKSAGSVGGPQAAIEEALAAAQEMHAQGEPDQAAQIYAAVLQNVPDNMTALAGLAGCLFDSGEHEKAREVLTKVPEQQKDDPQIRAVEARLALAEQVAHLGNPAELQARLAADPVDHQARFDLAMIANALDHREEAADGLLEIMKADRTWNDDGARKQLLQFFEAWGFKDPASMSGRRKLSSLLFS